MIGRAPAFQFYAGDWLASTKIALMTPAQEGAYIRLLAHAWNDPDCSIPDDDSELAILSRLGEEWLKGGSQVVRRCFVNHPEKTGRLVNDRLLEERQKSNNWRQKSSAAGVKSGQARRKQSKQKTSALKVGSQLVDNCFEPNTNQTRTLQSSPSSSNKNKDMSCRFAPQVQEIFSYWQLTLNHPTAKLDSKRTRIIEARFKDKFTVADLKLAIDGCRSSPFHQGVNKDGKVYDDLELILRDVKHVEDFIQIKRGGNGLVKPEQERRVVV